MKKTPRDISWSTGTDEEIVRAIAAADAGEIDLYNDNGWRVGDTRTVSLSAMEATGTYNGVTWSVNESHVPQDVEFVLMNKGGKTLNDGTECHFIVGMKNCLKTPGYMNSTSTNNGGWESCARRTWCNGAFYQAIPSALRSIFKQFKNVTATGTASDSTTSTDYFALPSEKEVFGSVRHANSSAESSNSQFTWYATSANRIKKINGHTDFWWERSPHANDSSNFCCVNKEGLAGQTYAGYPDGLSPFGCI